MVHKKKTLVRQPEPERKIAWPRWTGFRGMTLQDWLPIVGALLIPVMIAAGTWGITWQQGKIEDQRAEAERELAEQRAQDEALQAYLDKMSMLLLEKDLRNSADYSEVRTLARARTTTIVQRLDADANQSVMGFLYEAGLMGGQQIFTRQPKTRSLLEDADLQGAHLEHVGFGIYAVLSGADLSKANLSGASLVGAELSNADLSNADLTFAHLRDANLSGANLSNAHLSGNEMSGVDLSGATMPDGQTLRGDKTPNGPTFEEWLKSKGRE